MLQLRSYQGTGVNNIREAYRAGKRAPLFVLPTGGGKTVVFSYIAANTAARGKRVLILVHRIELLRQTSAALMKSGVAHGMINPKYRPDPFAPVQVASVQTIIRRLDKYPPFDLIIIDEAHHASAGTWSKIIGHYPNARLLGVTATPMRGDGSGLGAEAGGWFDEMIQGPQISELIDMGFLVRPVVYAPKEKLDLTGVRTKGNDYDPHALEELLDKPTITGDAVDHYRRLCPGTPAVAFCASVKHAQHVAEQFRQAGYRAYHADGSMEDDVRRRILNGLGNGSVDVVTSCDLISEGTDIPAIGCAILLRPTQSLGLYIQQVGRALRPCEGKDRAIILDHVGNVITHGMPDEYREWSLEGNKKRKRKKNEDEEKASPVRQCPNCYAIHEAKFMSCTICGHVYEVAQKDAPKQIDGELKQLTPADIAAIKRNKILEVAKADTLEKLIEIQNARGFKPGWAHVIWRNREKKKQHKHK